MGIIPLLLITYAANTISEPATPKVQACSHPSHYVDQSHNHGSDAFVLENEEISPARRHQLQTYVFDEDKSTQETDGKYELQMHVFDADTNPVSVDVKPIKVIPQQKVSNHIINKPEIKKVQHSFAKKQRQSLGFIR